MCFLRALLQCILLAGFCLACEVNAFFMKYVLWIPPRNMLNTYRLFVFFAMVIPAVNEYYYYVTDVTDTSEDWGRKGKKEKNKSHKLGVFTWIFLTCTVLEFLIVYKFGKELFSLPWPQHIKWSWLLAFAATLVFFCAWTARTGLTGLTDKKHKRG